MKEIILQVSPESKSAYFKDYITVTQQELQKLFEDISFSHFNVGQLEFFKIQAENLDLEKLARLSFVQGIYETKDEFLKPIAVDENFTLHEDFVFGSKFKGKTNERLTQLLINVGLKTINKEANPKVKLLDPMCGRATTLLWALRYNLNAFGIEQDEKALGDIQRNLKKWTKLHRQKHKLSEGFLGGGSKKNNLGKFMDFSCNDIAMRVAIGDARNSNKIYKKEKFDLIISDLPYGVQHFTTQKTRNPIMVIKEALKAWKSSLKEDGAVVLAFNSNIPKRAEMIEAFENEGFKTDEFSAKHRMSESIVRDVIIFRK